MKDWNTYAQSRGGTKQNEGDAPRVSEYLFIKLADNWISVAVVIVMLIFTLGGFFCVLSNSAAANKVSEWFFDAAKLCLGVFLGLLTGSKSK